MLVIFLLKDGARLRVLLTLLELELDLIDLVRDQLDLLLGRRRGWLLLNR